MMNRIKRVLIGLAVLILTVSFLIVLIDQYVQRTGLKYIVRPDQAPVSDAILVLGAYVFPDGTLSPMLNDRLNQAYGVYQQGKAGKIVVSGDHGRKDYDEVNAMKKYLVDKGVSPEDVFMDHAGFSTYESIYRVRDIFQVKRVIIVTQGYHLTRAIFIARELGLEACGVTSDLHDYGEVMTIYRLRESAARVKDFFLAKFLKPVPTFLGETIPVTGDGRATDDNLP
ncbi:MAG: ElyC/SanA/YdcF family protein [Desulfotomaculaceae bacterium]|nr:ElyC/SanA/YdcF family protein [Desulfotomaculaceae bacterium]MDD4767285.1 ElyC/SanA/YdcF family protein [Desulfotomaculaceae bacterium]